MGRPERGRRTGLVAWGVGTDAIVLLRDDHETVERLLRGWAALGTDPGRGQRDATAGLE